MWRHTWRERIQLKQRLRALMRWEPRQCKGTFAFLWSKISSRDLILSFSQIHQKYKFMEGSLASRRRKLKSQVYTCILGVFKTWSLVSSYTDLLSGPWHQEQPSNDHQVEGKERGEYLVMTSGNCSSNYFYIILFFLQAEETMETQFLLSEQVYARAKVFSDDGNSQITMICIYTDRSSIRCHQLTRSVCGLEPTWCLSTPSTMLRSCSIRTANRLNKTLLKLPGISITWEIRWPSLR